MPDVETACARTSFRAHPPPLPMRLVLAALVLLASVPALAQSQYADSAGVFVSLNQFQINSGGLRELDGTVGYRFASGTDLGIRVGHYGGFNYDETQLGLLAGITRRIGTGSSGRLEGAVQYGSSGGTRQRFMTPGDAPNEYDYRLRSVSADLSAMIGQRIPLGGSLALRPAVGGYATARRFVSREYPEGTLQVERTAASGGVQFELPLTFRLLGADAAFVPFYGRFVLTGARALDNDIPSGALFRLNF